MDGYFMVCSLAAFWEVEKAFIFRKSMVSKVGVLYIILDLESAAGKWLWEDCWALVFNWFNSFAPFNKIMMSSSCWRRWSDGQGEEKESSWCYCYDELASSSSMNFAVELSFPLSHNTALYISSLENYHSSVNFSKLTDRFLSYTCYIIQKAFDWLWVSGCLLGKNLQLRALKMRYHFCILTDF